MFSTRKKAIETPPFTGDMEWFRWFDIFTSDCAANGWNESEVFAALRVLNRDGPGAIAIQQHAKSGGTYLELVTALTVVCGATDPDLRWRRAEGLRQVYGETSRNFGLRVINVTREAAAGEGYPEHWIMRKICTIFMNGLRDPGLRDHLISGYDHRCHSIQDLFNMSEQYIQREHRFASGELTATKDCYATMCAALKKPFWNDGEIYLPMSENSRGRIQSGRPSTRGGRNCCNPSRFDGEDNFSLRNMGSVQCESCKLYGHFSGDCREKPQGYLALAKPLVESTSEVLVACTTSSGSNRNQNKNKVKNKKVVTVEKSNSELN